MPAYDYACKRCIQTVRIMKAMDKAANEERCPSCQEPMDRIYTAPAGHVQRGTPGFHRPR